MTRRNLYNAKSNRVLATYRFRLCVDHWATLWILWIVLSTMRPILVPISFLNSDVRE